MMWIKEDLATSYLHMFKLATVDLLPTFTDDSSSSYEIFKYARMAIDPKVDLTRYDVPRAGLKLFSRHATQLRQYLIEDYENIYMKMSYWSHHRNRDMLQLGMRAVEAFLTQIAEMLKEKARDWKEGRIFKYFLCQFQEIMHNESANDKELSLAIRGYGLLAGPCKCYMKETDVQFMFLEMLTKTEQQFLSQTEDFENRLYNMASYLESLACIVREMESVSETHAQSLEQLMVLLLENIHHIHHSKHFLCHRALLSILLAMMPKGSSFTQLLSGFVFQSLIRTCSFTPVVEIESEVEDDTGVRKVTYLDFMDSWKGLLDATLIKDFATANISLEMRYQLTDAVYNEIMTAIIKVLDRLDLSSSSASHNGTELQGDDSLTRADPLMGVQANRPRDFQVFINLVDFCKDLLPNKHYEKFECWLFTFTHKLILMSAENPLASGLYKLLALSMKVANKINFFQDSNDSKQSPVKSEESNVQADTINMGICIQTPNIQKSRCQQLVTKFSKEVLVRMKQYRDDLLASCLIFILSLPKEIIMEQMVDVVPAMQVTLNLGASYLPLAMVAMDALEYWSHSLPTNVMQPFYASILPCLDSFLKNSEKGAEEMDTNLSTNKSTSFKGRRKLAVRLIKGRTDTTVQSSATLLSQVKHRILQYLGQLGGSLNSVLLSQVDQESAAKAIAWDVQQHLKFEMPFVDMKTTIYLDPFLPRVSELANKSSDRQSKVAACELLHSLVLFSIGRGAQQPGVRVERTSMASLYKKVFPVMLKLACDVEQVAQQLFEPLMMQLIHWFTNNNKSESEETIALLDAIYEGLIQQSDTAVRDFSARCLQEFLKWSIKQSSIKVSEMNPANAKSVLKRLYSYALHPSPFKRLGAAIAFNNIYMIFREEEPLVNMFTFELLVHFVESLAIAHGDEKSLGTQEQCCKSLEHLEKIIRHKQEILKVPNKARKEPRSWTSVTLDIGVRWLTRQCGRPQTQCRHMCMKLSYQLAPLLKGVKTPAAFFQACLKGKGPNYWIGRFEGGGGHTGSKEQGIEGTATLLDQSDVFSIQAALSWFDKILAALDCYTWVLGENLLSPTDLFKGKGGAGSHVFVSIEHFLKNIALADVMNVTKMFSKKQEEDFFTPKEVDCFNRAKCTVIVRVMNFLTILLAKHKKDALSVVPADIFTTELWELMFCCVVQPKDVCFDVGDVEIMKNLPLEMAQTLEVFTLTFKAEMVKHFSAALHGERQLLACLPLSLVDESQDFYNVEQTLSGYRQLLQAGLLLPCLQGSSREEIAQLLLENVFKGIVVGNQGSLTSITLTPSSRSVATEMLMLAFSLGLPTSALIESVFDCSPVTSKSVLLQHGEIFFSTFKSSVCQFCVSRMTEVVRLLVERAEAHPRRVSSLLAATLDYVCKDKGVRKNEGSSVQTAVLSIWSNLSCWWSGASTQDDQGTAVLILSKLLLIDSKFTSSQSNPAFEDVFSMYLSLLTDTKTSLTFKSLVLDLLPFFANVAEPFSSRLKLSLDRLAADSFPLRSSELPNGSPKFKAYISTLDKILSAFSLSGSLMLLEYLISIFCREPHHVHEETIQAAIVKFIKRLPRDKQKVAADVPFNIFAKTTGFPSEIRRAAVERVCLPMLRLVQKSSVVDFFTDHITQLKTMLEGKLNKSSDVVLECQLTTRIGCFQLLEVMYSRLHKDDVVGMMSVINKEFSGGNVKTGKELTAFVSTTAHEAKREDTRSEATLLELRRHYHCAAYNLMVAFISRTQTELRYYTAFLFEEKENKGQLLLENLIDKNRTYEFPLELLSPLEHKKRFVSIHEEVKERWREEEEEGLENLGTSYHLASQYLADSSLSDDVSQYFSFSGTAPNLPSSSSRRKMRSAQVSDEGNDVQLTMEEDYIELELDDLNQHECMAAMIAVIKHMTTTKISPEAQEGAIDTSMPSWMEKLHQKMSSSSTHHNIRLFIAKLVMNLPQIFQPYASHWFQPLTQLIICGPLSPGSINYFVVDLVVTMVSWHKRAIPKDTEEEKAMVSRLVHFLIRNIYHETRQVFRNNLEMLKTLLECWKPRINLPYQEIYCQFNKADPNGKGNLVGIQVLGVVLACNYSPYGPSAAVDRDTYFSKLANNMGNTNKTVYAPAAEVCGMIFHYLAAKADEREGTFHTHVNNLMMGLHQGRPDNFITSVHKMQKHYPAIAERFVNKLLYMLPNLHGEFRTLCLQVLHSHIHEVEDVYMELKSKGIETSLNHRDEATQLISLKIVQTVLPQLKSAELAVLLPLVTAFGSNPSHSCRYVMYDILMWVYDNYRDERSTDGDEILLETKESLLKGLGDTDMVCRLNVQNFWSSETRLPVGTLDRLVAMLEAMYSPRTEQQYLSYATNLLLEMTTKSPDYQREIFELPLSECKFSDYSVKSSWRQRHAAMTPLFATQASQSLMEFEDSVDGVKATQDVKQFTQTLESGVHKGPFNWLTQSSLDTYSADPGLVTMDTVSQSSLLFTFGNSDMSARNTKRPKPGSSFGTKRLQEPKASTSAITEETNISEEGRELLRLKRRFIKDSEQSKIFFAKRQTRIKEMREKAIKDQQACRENQVTMYRKYRAGDLPDIQIKYSYIIAPLQALAQRDNTVARLLFSAVFKAIFDGMDTVKTETEVTAVIRQINTSLNMLLSTSTQYFPPFIGCILDIVYSLRTKLQLPLDSIAASSMFSKLQSLGIVLLEENLLQDEPVEPPLAKRGRMEAQIRKDVPQWIELSRLYKSLDEFDVLLGIFSGKIGTQPITQDAVQAEARGDYSEALKIYEEALACRDLTKASCPSDAEVDLWEDCKMDCLQNLCQWTELEKLASSTVDSGDPPNLNQLWEDTYLQEHFLPFIMTSKLKQMLQGDQGQQSLLDFVDAAMKVHDRRIVLENHYPEELALMYLWQEDFDRSRHYCNIALHFFLQEWSSTESLMVASRTRTLQKLQPLIELQEFLSFIADEGNFLSLGRAQSLVQKWNCRTPHVLTDPVIIWDDVVTNRTVYLDVLSNRLEKAKDCPDRLEVDGADMFLDTKLRLKLNMAESCKEQNNFALTFQLLKETHGLCKRSTDLSLVIDWTHLYASTHHRKVTCSLDAWSCDMLSTLVTTLDQLGKLEETRGLVCNPSLARYHHVLSGQAFKIVALGFQKLDIADFADSSRLFQKLLEYTGLRRTDKQEVVERLLGLGYQKLKNSLSLEDTKGRCGERTFGQAEANLATAKYCDEVLRMKEDDEILLAAGTLESFPETVVVCLLNAMKLNSEEALQRFPRLLQIVEKYPETMSTFIAKSGQTPCWMFLLWISQMLAILDKPESKAVRKILEVLAVCYPQAVIYPLKLSSEGYKFGTGSQGQLNMAMLNKLNQLVTLACGPMTDRFIAALECFGQLDQDMKELFEEILKLLRQGKKEQVKEKYQTMYRKILDYKKRETTRLSTKTQDCIAGTADDMEESHFLNSSPLDIGSYGRKFADKFKGEFDKKFGEDGKKMLSMSPKEFQNVKVNFQRLFEQEVKTSKGSLHPPEKLSEYSRWMANFNPNTHGRGLELPGQYTGLCKPKPEYHVKISGFDQRVKVMPSIRKPKRICIRGNDEKEYMFLVKGGEDLRQDQRIEQLFYIMNRVLCSNPACNQRKLALKTYQVIPMTPRVGLIEWVSDTIPLKDFIMDSLTDHEKKFYHSAKGPLATHQAWLSKAAKKDDPWPVRFAAVFNKYSSSDTVLQFSVTENKVPWDLMRRSFHQLSTSPEAFHFLRTRCLKSHALLSVCQYILGIGDRHLSNFMVNMNTGEMVGIDFGHAFGSATQFLPIPELVPFRLTRQLRNVMLPLDVKGLVENTMIHVLRALRTDSDLLLNTMDIFIKEPSLDWLHFAERQAQAMSDDELELMSLEGGILEMYPKEKVSFVKRKLRGENPCQITREELQLGHCKKSAFKDYEKVVLGQDDSVRQRLPLQSLTVEQQVAALIDQASDPNILGRTWIGWEPWV